MDHSFRNYIYERAAEVYSSDLSIVEDRLIRELEYIKGFGLENEILAAEMLIQSYKCRSIPYFIRGLISSLCVPYLLGITEVDPMKYNIPIEMAIGINGDKIPTFTIEHDGSGFLDIKRNREMIHEDLSAISATYHDEFRSFDNHNVWEYFSNGYYPEQIGMDSEDMSIILKRFKPHSLKDLARAISASLSTGLYQGNGECLLDEGILAVTDLPSTREDFIELLIAKGLSMETAYTIMNYVKTGRPLPEKLKLILEEIDSPEWFLPFIEKIAYLLPRSYCVELAIYAYKITLQNYIESTSPSIKLD